MGAPVDVEPGGAADRAVGRSLSGGRLRAGGSLSRGGAHAVNLAHLRATATAQAPRDRRGGSTAGRQKRRCGENRASMSNAAVPDIAIETPVGRAWSEALALLEQDLRLRDAAARTRRAYAVDLRQFAGWSCDQGITLPAVGPKAVRRYIAHLSAEGAAPSTSARKLASLRALFSSQREHGLIAQNPADLVSTPRRSEHLPRVLTAREAARLLDGIPAAGPLGV